MSPATPIRNSVSCARIFRAVCAGLALMRRAMMPKLTATTVTNEIRQASAAILAALRCDPSIALVVILFSPAAGDSLALERATATGAREFHLLPLALAGGWAEAAPFTPALAGLLAFFRRHLLPPLLPSLGPSPPIQMKIAIPTPASGAINKILFVLMFCSSLVRKFVVNALQPLAQMQNCVALARE